MEPEASYAAVAPEKDVFARNDLDLDSDGAPLALERVLAVRPAAIAATAQHTDAGLTLLVPPRGILRGSHGIFGFAIGWLIVMAIITVIWTLIFIPPPQPQPGQGGGMVVFYLVASCAGLFLLVFWAVGALLILTGVDRGRRRAIIDVVSPSTPDAALLLTVKRLLKTEQHQWLVTDLRFIQAAISDEQVDRKIFYEVRIRPKKGKTESFLSGRPKQEVEWIAAVLRAATGLPSGTKEHAP